MTTNGARHIERTSVVKRFAPVFSRGLVAAALCLTAGIAEPGRADETTHGAGRAAPAANAFHVAPDSRGTVVAGAPTGQSSDAPLPGPAAGRVAPLDQSGCSICLEGAASVTWNGSSGSFHVDSIGNYRSSGSSGLLDLKVVLTSSPPVFGQTINSFAFSSALSFPALQAGYGYTPVDSGTIAFYGSSISPGEYWLLLFLRENVGDTWGYTDWILMDKKVSCSGSGCTTVNPPPPSCTEDAYTMCLAYGRYRVTGRWKDQYAGGAQATLSKAKLTDVTGAFWIADANTYEFMARISTATNNGRAWVSILTFTDVEFWVAITDVTNGQSKEYHSNPGNRTLIFDPSFFVYP
jgi:hypothetical protein